MLLVMTFIWSWAMEAWLQCSGYYLKNQPSCDITPVQNTAAGTAHSAVGILTYFFPFLSLFWGASQAPLLLRWSPYPEGRMSNRWLSGWAGTAALYLALYPRYGVWQVSDGGQLVANYSPSRKKKRHRCAEVWCVWQIDEDQPWQKKKQNKQKKSLPLLTRRLSGLLISFFKRCSRWLAGVLHVKASVRCADSSQQNKEILRNKEDSAHGDPHARWITQFCSALTVWKWFYNLMAEDLFSTFAANTDYLNCANLSERKNGKEMWF